MEKSKIQYLPDILCPVCGTEMSVQDYQASDSYSTSEVCTELECCCDKCKCYRTLYCVYKPAYYYFVKE